MAMRVELTDNSKIIADTMGGNVGAALEAMGIKAQALILAQMRSYGKPIYRTGDLQRDLSYEAEPNSNGGVVRVGSSLNYSTYVHEGTSRMSGRPYISDGLSGKGQTLQQVAADALKQGF